MTPEGQRPLTDEELVAALQLEERNNPDYRRNRDLDVLTGYGYYLGLDISSMALSVVKSKGSFKWYDMCCGTFSGGRELKRLKFGDLQDKIEARGIDLDTPTPEDQVSHGGKLVISRGNVVNYPIAPDVDLITCVNGLYLVDQYMGFAKLREAIEHWYNSLPVGGMLRVMRELCITGYKKQFNIAEYLKQELSNAVTEEIPPRYYPPEYRNYLSITKADTHPLSIPRTI